MFFVKLQFKYCVETLNAFSDLQMAFLKCFSSQFKDYFTSYKFTQVSVPLQSWAQEQSLLLLVPRCTCNTARILRLFRVLINKTEKKTSKDASGIFTTFYLDVPVTLSSHHCNQIHQLQKESKYAHR